MAKQLDLPFPEIPSIWCNRMDPVPYERVVKRILLGSHEVLLIFDDGSKLRQILSDSFSGPPKTITLLRRKQPEQLPLPFPAGFQGGIVKPERSHLVGEGSSESILPKGKS